jgi:hypothetical protein
LERFPDFDYHFFIEDDVELIDGSGKSASTTWHPDERARREIAGHLQATRLLRGQRWARAFAMLAGIVLLAASVDPRRAEDARANHRLRGRLNLSYGFRGDLGSDVRVHEHLAKATS